MSILSVVIPAYNRSHLIGETLHSLLIQTRPADEIVIVDDGSTDKTEEVAIQTIEKWKSTSRGKTPECIFIRQHNSGPGAARNAGFRASRGDFIHFFDSDDLAAPNKHALQSKLLESTEADIAIGPWLQGRFYNGCFESDNQVLQQNGLPRDLIKALLTNWSFVPHSSLFRRSIIEISGGFPEDLFVAEDQFMFLSCLLAGAKVVHSPGTIEFYRLGDPGKITENKDWSLHRLTEWARFLIKARDVCKNNGIDPITWPGYRCRILESLHNLENAHCQDFTLIKQIQDLAPVGLGAAVCKACVKLGQWRGGLQQRTTGGRANRAFHIGPVSSDQILSLKQLGYEYRAPKRLPWFSSKKTGRINALADH